METLLTTVLSSALIFGSTLIASTPQTTQVAFTRVLPEKDYVGYVVEKNDTLENIAEKAYGAKAYWTTIWNDNELISDPEVVVKDSLLKIRIEKPVEPMALASVLVKRNNLIVNQKNDELLKQNGYVSAVQVSPTAVPTQANPVIAPKGVSAISDEAITYLGNCEAGNNPVKNTGNGYYGAFQFSASTWNRLNTGYDRADLAPLDVQQAAVKQLLQKSSVYGQFPACANKMRSAGLI